jgi:Ca-activated chloride channel family protein
MLLQKISKYAAVVLLGAMQLAALQLAAQSDGAQAKLKMATASSQTTTAPEQTQAAPPQGAPVQQATPGQATPGQATPGPEQAAPGTGNQDNFVLKVPVNEVNLVFTVTDKSGRFVKNLRQQDFELLDAHKPPAKVFRFTQQTNLPLRVGLLIDTSSSVHSRFAFEQRSAIDFLQQILRPREDLAFVMGFDSTPEMTQDFTSNLDKLATGINGLKSNGGTALYDAVYKACRDNLLPIKSDEPLRKAIVLLSDGHDNQSRVHLDEAVKMCQRAETIVYTISTNVSPTKDEGDEILSAISDKTGGRTFVPLREEDVAHAFYEISDELRAQYALQYRPADFKTNGEFRDIWLQPVDRNKYHVRARKGYFAPRE